MAQNGPFKVIVQCFQNTSVDNFIVEVNPAMTIQNLKEKILVESEKGPIKFRIAY